MFGDLGAFAKRLGLPHSFYEKLLAEDDWSFVIKTNALVEAACTHALASRLHAPELVESFASLDLGNSKFGKVVLLRKLKAITAEQARVLQSLYQLRNSLAHDVKQVTFNVDDYVAAFDKNQRNSFVNDFGHGVADTVPFGGKHIPREKFVLQNPKISIWITVAEIIACLYLEHEVAQLHVETFALIKKSSEAAA